jgi:viroplasmin and RNaseH domain-containing protein
VVAVGKNENSFSIYADLRTFIHQIEGYPESLYESCDSYDQAHKYLEAYLHKEKRNETMEMTAIALAAI